MKFYGKAEDVANEIVKAFEEPNLLPKALAPIFIKRKDEIPCRKWSFSNQLTAALRGHSDARGYRQWQEAGRFVKKGEKGFPILVPIHRKIEETDKETGKAESRMILSGFKHAVVFGLAQTDGKELPVDEETAGWIKSLPLLEVAEKWELSVEAVSGSDRSPLGSFSPVSGGIAVAVKNLSTWCHELTHAADHKAGNLKERGQHWKSEAVAELGASVLLTILGDDSEADLGGCWQYVSAYAKQAGIEPITACQSVLKRTCEAVNLILDEAERIASENEMLVQI